jgi:hypothetical protein
MPVMVVTGIAWMAPIVGVSDQACLNVATLSRLIGMMPVIML